MGILLLNADLGEGFDTDGQMFPWIDVANIACGGHAGDVLSMKQACELALEHRVQAGAHPSYPDREGFGRRRPSGSLQGLYSELCRQMEAFEQIAARCGLKTRHFKPHGQLYNDAAHDPEMAGVLLRVAADFPHLALYALAASPLVEWAEEEGVEVLQEAFPDRRYTADGRLQARSQAGAVLHDTALIVDQALRIAQGLALETAEGGALMLQADTLCLHGDTPQAVMNAQAVREALMSLRST